VLENSTATVFGLAVLILMFGRVSGAHFNPVVSAADWLLGRRTNTGIAGVHVMPYFAAQTVGAVAGALLANAIFDLPVVEISSTDRACTGHGIGKIAATAGLVALIFLLARTGRHALSAAAVGAYIGATYWFTSSMSFANPPSPSAEFSPTPSPGSPQDPSRSTSAPRSSAPPSVSASLSHSSRNTRRPPTPRPCPARTAPAIQETR
jgi:hypothetical protein